jgi:hypothetical protein
MAVSESFDEVLGVEKMGLEAIRESVTAHCSKRRGTTEGYVVMACLRSSELFEGV